MANARKILIVDDDTDLRDTLVEQLSLHDEFEASAVDTGAKGATAAKANSPDLVLMDVGLPDTDGREVVRSLRKGGFKAPIIMLTGHSEKRRVTVARDAGVTEFLAKPISAKGLYQRILNVVANPRPFIKTKTYFGPDRRRNTTNAYIGPERRVGGEVEVMQQPSLLEGAVEVPALGRLPLPEGGSHAIAWAQSSRRRTTFAMRRSVTPWRMGTSRRTVSLVSIRVCWATCPPPCLPAPRPRWVRVLGWSRTASAATRPPISSARGRT